MMFYLTALQLDPNNESVKENIQVAEQKLIEEQHHADHNPNSRSSQESQNQSAGGSRSHAMPPPFNSMPFNPNDIASMFMNMAANATNAHQGSHWGSNPQERQEDTNTTGEIANANMNGILKKMGVVNAHNDKMENEK
ncbi:uncharacterized protein LOC133299307 [Gastrolobium bilobum]|uniref:uncharacterized protein LOC133299307 n=1 Tax=Gastrolobium bilobum TaxID=150636 RepID=UPI002AAF8536|nr:uncharacterized protein LOC133299307 [Gastrolobium bilobum]